MKVVLVSRAKYGIFHRLKEIMRKCTEEDAQDAQRHEERAKEATERRDAALAKKQRMENIEEHAGVEHARKQAEIDERLRIDKASAAEARAEIEAQAKASAELHEAEMSALEEKKKGDADRSEAEKKKLDEEAKRHDQAAAKAAPGILAFRPGVVSVVPLVPG